MRRRYITKAAMSRIIKILKGIEGVYVASIKKIEILLKRLFGWRERGLRGVNCQKDTGTGILFFAALTHGVKRVFGKNYTSIV